MQAEGHSNQSSKSRGAGLIQMYPLRIPCCKDNLTQHTAYAADSLTHTLKHTTQYHKP